MVNALASVRRFLAFLCADCMFSSCMDGLAPDSSHKSKNMVHLLFLFDICHIIELMVFHMAGLKIRD